MSVTLASLTAKRAKLRNDMLAMQRRAEEADPENATMSSEQQAAFDAMKVALANLEASIANRAATDAFERAEAGRTLSGGDKQLELAKRAFRPGIAIAGASGLRVDDGPEREISAELARRSGRKVEGIMIPFESFHRPIERRVVTPAGAGAGIIGTYLDESLYVDALRAAIVGTKLGARYVTGLDTNIDIPRLAATAQAQWVADGSPIATDTSEAFDKVSLRPHTVGAICEFTRFMLLTSTPFVQDAVRNDMVQVIARALDLALLNGTGGVQPIGILGQLPAANILSDASGNGGWLTWQKILGLMLTVQNANAPDTALGFVGNPSVRASAMNTLKFPGSISTPVMENPDSLAGYPFQSTTQIPLNTKGTGTNLSTLIYGAWDQAMFALFGDGVEVLTNPYGNPQFSSGNVQVRVIATADVGVLHPQAFAAFQDLSPFAITT